MHFMFVVKSQSAVTIRARNLCDPWEKRNTTHYSPNQNQLYITATAATWKFSQYGIKLRTCFAKQVY